MVAMVKEMHEPQPKVGVIFHSNYLLGSKQVAYTKVMR